MADLGYEIKYGKHIAFKPKDKLRFTSSKTIGEDYTEERLKELIAEKASIKTHAVKKRIGNVIDMNTNMKVKKAKVMNIGQPNITLKQLPIPSF